MYKLAFKKDFEYYVVTYIIINLSKDETGKIIGFSSMPVINSDDIFTSKKLNKFTESDLIAFKNYAITININFKDLNIILDSIKLLD